MIRFFNILLLALPAVFLTAFPAAFAQSQTEAKPKANPTLTARIDGVNSANTVSTALKITALDAKINLRGLTAETTLNIRFDNPTPQTLEGEFALDMPLNSVVSGYALDVNGQMVDGVLVPPYQARRAYEQRVTRRVDPGLVEVTHGSRFSTRVFPIFPNAGRTIQLKFATALNPQTGYVLPFSQASEIGSFKLAITGSSLAEAPAITLPKGVKGQWSGTGLVVEARQVSLDGTLQIKPKANPVTLSNFSREGRFFDVIGSFGNKTAAAAKPKLTVFWDSSRSRLGPDVAREAKLLQAYVDRASPQSIQLVAFDSSGARVSAVANGAALSSAINAITYGGATSFAVLQKVSLNGADTCLLFSDGLSTLDKRSGFAPNCRLFSVTSLREADRGFLGSRARRNGGDLIDLASISDKEALDRLLLSTPKIASVTDESGEPIEFTVLDGGENGWRVIGEAPDAGGIKISFGHGMPAQVFDLSEEAPTFDGTGALWASNMIAANPGESSSDDLLKLARRYSVASTIASFVVLETPQDYAQARIDPPASYPKQQREIYNQIRAIDDRVMADRKAGQFNKVATAWRQLTQWWTKPVLTQEEREQRRMSRSGEPVPPPVPQVAVPRVAPAPPPPVEELSPMAPPPPPPPVSAPAPEAGEIITTASARREAPQAGATQTQDVSVEAAAAPPSPGMPQQNQQAVKISTWDASRPYLRALTAAGANWPAVFRAQEAEYGELPAFYLDVSAWLERRGDRAGAIRMASSALDLPARNNDTIAIVAARLTRLGDINRAIWLLEQMNTLETDRPQPRRTLALALIQRAGTRADAAAKADLQRAFNLLAEVVNTPWDGAYDGIEVIALNEANAIAGRLRQMGGTTRAINAKLLTPLNFDIRIVAEWNTKETDMDLWVDEPDGARVIYSAPRSPRGGHLSDDMTNGFGPEEYFIRNAGPGTYTIRMNTFSTDRLNPNGPTTVTARIYRNFGRPNQTEQIIDVEILPGQEGERRIGKVVIGAKT